MLDHPALERMVQKLGRRASLQPSDRAALNRLSFRRKAIEPGGYIVREGTTSQESAIILQGFAFRHKLNDDGGRQICSFHIPGDFVDLEGAMLEVADHNVQALNQCEIATIATADLLALIDAHPRVGRALWVDTLIDGSVYREWITNIGRRSARQRLAHLFCELAKRLRSAGLGDENGYGLPMTQEQLADATGLTSVHVNRSLKALEADGLIVRHRRFLGIPDWDRLRAESGFTERYLHLDKAA